ncbi:DUF6176 family protein [Mesorhizobium sp. AaZ16]|uniref:DUF6176 family protein n=1 Tax=Mesorhizobium sp. AaZ16 TaxID=3402289 RepID=UPI00374F8E0C
MRTRCVKIKLKDGTLTQVDDWAAEINKRTNEALETMQREGVSLEAAFLDYQADGVYLISVMRADDFEKARAMARSSTADIDAYHRRFKEACWEERTELSALVDLSIEDQ